MTLREEYSLPEYRRDYDDRDDGPPTRLLKDQHSPCCKATVRVWEHPDHDEHECVECGAKCTPQDGAPAEPYEPRYISTEEFRSEYFTGRYEAALYRVKMDNPFSDK